MRRALHCVAAFVAVALFGAAPVKAADAPKFWDLDPDEVRRLVAAPQVMVTRTETGLEAYCRCPVVLQPRDIPKVMKDAIVAIEDKRYFDHGGVDVITLLSVLRGGLDRGGSTIPMQLLKNLVFHDLWRRDTLSRIERKGAELWHAGRLDEAVGKEELLAAYLNQIEFGGRDIVGLYRASRFYFRKEPKDLNLYEAAMLAGMVQAPARLNPLKEATRERAHERAALVLGLMVEQGKISEAQRRNASKRGLQPGILPEFKIQAHAFTEWITQNWAAGIVKTGETLRFFVTLDPLLQFAAEGHLRSLVAQGTVPADYEAAAVMMDGAGHVRSMVGAIDWTQAQFNHAVKARVQPGSTAKLPLIIAACLAGRRPDSHVVDLPISGGWPANGPVGYRGDTTLSEAIASSRNAAAVRLAKELGVKAIADAGRRLGIDPGTDLDPTFVLGTFSTTPLTMTAAYAVIASGGYQVAPSGVLAVVDGRGEVRANFLQATRKRVIPERCVSLTREILRDVVRAGTGRRAAVRRGEAYGKTGTSTGNADAWFIGWSGERVLGIWMGRPHGSSATIGLAGAGPPAELFRRIQDSASDAEEGPKITAASDRSAPAGKTGSMQRATPARVPLPPRRPYDQSAGRGSV
jgi:penicillin-binding protein 1A